MIKKFKASHKDKPAFQESCKTKVRPFGQAENMTKNFGFTVFGREVIMFSLNMHLVYSSITSDPSCSSLCCYRLRSEGYVLTGVCLFNSGGGGREVWHQMHHGIGHMVGRRYSYPGGRWSCPGGDIHPPPPTGQDHLAPPIWELR